MSDRDEKRKPRATVPDRGDPDLAGLGDALHDLADTADDLIDRLFQPEPSAPDAKLSENPLRDALDELGVDARIDSLQMEPAVEKPAAATVEPESVWTAPVLSDAVDDDELPDLLEPAVAPPTDAPVKPAAMEEKQEQAAPVREPGRVEVEIPEPVARPATPTTNRPLFSEPAKGPTPVPNYLEQAPVDTPPSRGIGKAWLAVATVAIAAVAGGLWWQSTRSPNSGSASVDLSSPTRSVTLTPAGPDRSAAGERGEWPPPPPRLPRKDESPNDPDTSDTAGSPALEPEPVAKRTVAPEPERVVRPIAATPPAARPEPVVEHTVAKPTPPRPEPVVERTVAELPMPRPEPVVERTVVDTADADAAAPIETPPPPVVAAPAPTPAPTPAVMVDRVEPVYQETLRQRSGGGVVTLEVLVGENGKAIRVLVKTGIPGSELEGRAIDAVLRSTFRPATENGKPVRSWVTQTYRFDP